MSLIEVEEGDEEQSVDKFIQSFLDFKVSAQQFDVEKALFSISQIKLITNEALEIDSQAYVSPKVEIKPILQEHPSPVLGLPRIELRVQDNSIYGELLFSTRPGAPFSIGNASFYLTLILNDGKYNVTAHKFTIVVRPLKPRFRLPETQVAVLEDQFFLKPYVNSSFAVDIRGRTEATQGEAMQALSFSVLSDSLEEFLQ